MYAKNQEVTASCSRGAKALSSLWRATRGTLDTRRRNRSDINDDEIERRFIYFVRIVFRFFFLSFPLDWESQENRATRWNVLKAGEKYTVHIFERVLVDSMEG